MAGTGLARECVWKVRAVLMAPVRTETERGLGQGHRPKGPFGDSPRSASVLASDIHSVRADLLTLQTDHQRVEANPLVIDHARRLEYLRLLQAEIRETRRVLDRLEGAFREVA